jgi:hypothetical protein
MGEHTVEEKKALAEVEDRRKWREEYDRKRTESGVSPDNRKYAKGATQPVSG